jgi:hypothetical protein
VLGALVKVAAAVAFGLSIARALGWAPWLPPTVDELMVFGVLAGAAYVLHEACEGVAALAGSIRAWWKEKRG